MISATGRGLVSIEDAARLTGLSVATVRQYVGAGLVSRTRRGLVDVEQVLRAQDRRRVRSSDPLAAALIAAAWARADAAAAAGVDVEPAPRGARPAGAPRV